jgi:uncharacterized protein Usg
MSDFELMLQDYRLTTAEIIYHMPDHPALLQSYIWQELDKNPDFPKLSGFLHFWERELDGKLHSVKVVACDLIKPSDVRWIGKEFWLH